jgi:(p)ppGpp synthase/HD superfamily hydrolase
MDITQAINFAAEAHAGQLYGDKPYTYHLMRVSDVARQYGADSFALTCCFLHDVIEDTDYTKEDLVERFGEATAHVVDLLTNKRSKEETFSQIRLSRMAVFVKLCDRIANMREVPSKSKYKKEYPLFKKTLYRKGEFENIWKELDELHS